MGFYGFAYISAPISRMYLRDLYLEKINKVKKLPVFDKFENKEKDINYYSYYIPSISIGYDQIEQLKNSEVIYTSFSEHSRLRIEKFKDWLTSQRYRLVFFCEGWDYDEVCRAEHSAALNAGYPIDIMYE